MSDIIKKFDVFSEINDEFKVKIKLFHIYEDWDSFTNKKGTNVLFITDDDKVYAFGNNYKRQCGFGHRKQVSEPQEIPELSGKQIKQFSIGWDFVLALSQQNRVFAWGENDFGQLGKGIKGEDYQKPSLIPSLENIIFISCGKNHNLVLDSEGHVFGWGNNRNGQVGCGQEINTDITDPIHLNSLPKIKSVYCFYYQSYAITTDGLVYSWGSNWNYCLGHKEQGSFYQPRLVCDLKNVLSVCCSRDSNRNNTYFLTNEGNIYFCGETYFNYHNVLQMLKKDLKFISLVSINSSQTFALSEDNRVYHLIENRIWKTESKTFFDYCINKSQMTYETIDLSYQNRFEQLCQIGSGAFGKVIRVHDKLLNAQYAVKIMGKITSEIEVNEQDLLKEVKLLSECDEKFVTKYFDSWFEQDQFYIKMELCSNNLKNIIEEKRKCFERYSFEQMCEQEYFLSSQLSKELLECVQYLHQLNPPVIHRDLKPANVLINYQSNNGRHLKLADFGIATYGSDCTKSHTRWMGTPQYMAPEVNIGTDKRATYSTMADVYSLGYILCDLFDYDINKSNNKNSKWIELGQIIKQMLNLTYKDRPNCAQVLGRYELWGIQRITEENKSDLTKLRQFENHFFLNYFNEKTA